MYELPYSPAHSDQYIPVSLPLLMLQDQLAACSFHIVFDIISPSKFYASVSRSERKYRYLRRVHISQIAILFRHLLPEKWQSQYVIGLRSFG